MLAGQGSGMDENQHSTPPPGQQTAQRSASTAAKLRAIREQTDRGLQDYARQLEEVEQEVNRRVEEFIASYEAESTEATSAEGDSATQLEQAAAEHEAQLAEFERRITALQESFDAQLAGRNEQADLDAEAIEKLQAELDAQQARDCNDSTATTELENRVEELQQQLQSQRDEYETLANAACETCAQTSQTLAEAERSLTELRHERDTLSDENGVLLELGETLEAQEKALKEQLAESETKREKLVESLEDAKSQVAELRAASQTLDAQMYEAKILEEF